MSENSNAVAVESCNGAKMFSVAVSNVWRPRTCGPVLLQSHGSALCRERADGAGRCCLSPESCYVTSAIIKPLAMA